MSLGGLIRRYTRPKRLLRLVLLGFGAWGIYTNYQAYWPGLKDKFSQTPASQVLSETINNASQEVGQQISRVLGKQDVGQINQASSGAEANQEDGVTIEKIFETVKEDLKTFPQREVKRVQKQICEDWLTEEVTESAEASPSPTPAEVF